MFTCFPRALTQAQCVIHHVEDVVLLQDSVQQVRPGAVRVNTFEKNTASSVTRNEEMREGDALLTSKLLA